MTRKAWPLGAEICNTLRVDQETSGFLSAEIGLAGVRGITPNEEQMAEILRNSYRDFHVKGFDYLCLKRTPQETHKFYFFEGDVAQAPEVVHPHDHRYHFTSRVIAGRMSNSLFRYDHRGETMEEFEYRSKLLGGNGFTWSQTVRLSKISEIVYSVGEGYLMRSAQMHTIRVYSDTVLHLVQYQDVVPEHLPTKCFSRSREPFNLSGLYGRFTEDQVLRRLGQLEEIAPLSLKALFEVARPQREFHHHQLKTQGGES